MIIQFKDRKKELKEIGEVVDSKDFQLFVLYGRRRIGKTELILNATKTKKRLYYLATGKGNLDRFYNKCVEFDEGTSKLKKDWEVLFDFLKDKADVVVLDEFQNMIQEDKDILNIFQSIVDINLKNSNLKLFLLGSSVSMITSKVLSYKSPLYGRRSGSMNLKPVSFFDLPGFFTRAKFEDLVNIYGFADGIPFYLIKIDKEFWKWLESEMVQEKSFLRDEVDFLVKYEFEDAGTYKLILEAIANGKTKLNEIKDFIKVKRTDISPYIKNLIEVGFVKREVPITENIKSRFGRYYISDNFLMFWFRYIYPNLSSIEEGIFDAGIIKNDYNSYLGHVFERVCRQFLVKNSPVKFTKLGRWWHKDKEIDLIGLNKQTREILFCECKWQNKVNPEKILENLKEKTEFVDWNKGKRREYYCIIAKSFSKKTKKDGVFLFDLKDLENVLR